MNRKTVTFQIFLGILWENADMSLMVLVSSEPKCLFLFLLNCCWVYPCGFSCVILSISSHLPWAKMGATGVLHSPGQLANKTGTGLLS